MSGGRTVDGGQIAFIGFLYQMLGALALRAWSEHLDPVISDDFDALLSIIREGEVYHEMSDIDVLISRLGLDQPDAYVLLQFKYSQHPEQYPITPSALADICQSFLRSTQHWTYQQRSITSYRVMTNRQPSSTLLPVLQQSEGLRVHPQFDTLEMKALLQKTEIISDLDFPKWIQALQHFASEYGVTPDEFEAGIERLIGKLVRWASDRQAPPIREEDLVKAFHNCDWQHKLAIADIRSRTKSHWEYLKDQLGVHGVPVRRKLLEEAENKLREHALVIFCGPGGSGKSVMAWHLLQNMQKQAAETGGSAAVFLPAWDIQPYTLSSVVGGLAGAPERCNEQMERALQRVHIANPTARPVFCLGLDGLDERRITQLNIQSIHEVIGWFWRREQALRQQRYLLGSVELPEAVLVVTCRDSDTITNDWLHGALSSSMTNDPPETLPISDYLPEELLEAVRFVMPSHIDRFEQTLMDPSIFVGSAGTMRVPYPPVNEETLNTLHHPAMWFALQNLNPDEQELLLDGDSRTLDLLAHRFLHWFFEKAVRRWTDWEREDIDEALMAVAREAAALQAAEYPYNIWKVVGCRGYGFLSPQQVKRLFCEALSAGVILQDDPERNWHWRHPFVGRYLARRAQEEVWEQ